MSAVVLLRDLQIGLTHTAHTEGSSRGQSHRIWWGRGKTDFPVHLWTLVLNHPALLSARCSHQFHGKHPPVSSLPEQSCVCSRLSMKVWDDKKDLHLTAPAPRDQALWLNPTFFSAAQPVLQCRLTFSAEEGNTCSFASKRTLMLLILCISVSGATGQL